MTEPEPWLRGPIPNVPAHLMPVLFSFQQVREDLAAHAAGITPGQLWHSIAAKHSLGYHLKHIAGSVDRLTTYLAENQLSEQQLTFLRNEHTADADLASLLALLHSRLDAAEDRLLQISADRLSDVRVVGRQQLPTTVLGLLVHVCEHTQRHLGQAILIARFLQQA